MQRFETAVHVTMYRCPPWPPAKTGSKHCAYGVPGGWQHAAEHASALALLWQFDPNCQKTSVTKSVMACAGQHVIEIVCAIATNL